VVGRRAVRLDRERRGQASFYTPYLQFSYAVSHRDGRTGGDPLALVPGVRAAVSAAEPGLPIFDVRTMPEDALSGTWARARFNAGLSGIAILALGLARTGHLTGVIAHRSASEAGRSAFASRSAVAPGQSHGWWCGKGWAIAGGRAGGADCSGRWP
jgi:hypothetical protein